MSPGHVLLSASRTSEGLALVEHIRRGRECDVAGPTAPAGAPIATSRVPSFRCFEIDAGSPSDGLLLADCTAPSDNGAGYLLHFAPRSEAVGIRHIVFSAQHLITGKIESMARMSAPAPGKSWGTSSAISETRSRSSWMAISTSGWRFLPLAANWRWHLRMLGRTRRENCSRVNRPRSSDSKLFADSSGEGLFAPVGRLSVMLMLETTLKQPLAISSQRLSR